jgi:hypothetical protein
MASAVIGITRSTRRGPAVGAPRALPIGSATDDVEMVVSFGAVYRRAEPAQGERRLLLAVLEDGIRTLLKHAGATRGRARTLQREALTWLLSDAHTDVFAFASICEALEIDPGRLRGQVMAKVRPGAPANELS